MNVFTAMSHLENLSDKITALHLVEALLELAMDTDHIKLKRNDANMHSLETLRTMKLEFLSEKRDLEKKLEKIEID